VIAAKPLHEILEKDWQRDVRKLAQQLGYEIYHTFDSRKSDTGFPDLVLVSRHRKRVIYLELKREEIDDRGRVTKNGIVSDRQRKWLADLFHAGAEVYLVRPRNLEALTTVLAGWNAQTGDARRQLVDELRPFIEGR
jgi:hypothetical protein